MSTDKQYLIRLKYNSIRHKFTSGSVTLLSDRFTTSCKFDRQGFYGNLENYGVVNENDIFVIQLIRKDRVKSERSISLKQILKDQPHVVDLAAKVDFGCKVMAYLDFTIVPVLPDANEDSKIQRTRFDLQNEGQILEAVEEDLPAPSLPASSVFIPDGFRLPDNFEIRIFKDGRAFYVDHNKKVTSWVRPILLPIHNDMPNGWEMRMNSDDRIFYVDHVNKITTWDKPTDKILKVRKEDTGMKIELPIGWEKRFDRSSGKAYFLDHNRRTTQWEDPRDTIREDPLPPGWKIQYTKSGIRYFINTIKKYSTYQDPREGKAKGPIGVLGVPIVYERAFHWKMANFRNSCSQHIVNEKFPFTVTRKNVFEDSFSVISSARAKTLLKKPVVVFYGEDGLDYGGIIKEWFHLVSMAIVDPSYGLFRYVGTGNYSLHINPKSYINENHLDYFRFIGRFLAMALLHGHHISCDFFVSFMKCLVHKPHSMRDIEELDPILFNSLKWIRDNDIDDSGLGLTFSTTDDLFGDVVTVDLIENGRNVDVTDDNKVEYIALITDFMCSNGIDEQMKTLIAGFEEVFPLTWLNYFDERELEVMFRGIVSININDWHANTVYKNCSESTRSVQFFWRYVHKIDDECRLRLIQFVTGTCHIPIGGFSQLLGSQGIQKFTINLILKSEEMLPISHTCFNRLDLPAYQTYEKLNTKLTMAIEETEGFGNE